MAGRRPQRALVVPPAAGRVKAPTLAELLEFAAGLPPEQARDLLARAYPMPVAPEPDVDDAARPPLRYMSWAQFLASTTVQQRLQWCRLKAKTANRSRLMPGPPDCRVTAAMVWEILQPPKGAANTAGAWRWRVGRRVPVVGRWRGLRWVGVSDRSGIGWRGSTAVRTV